MKGKMMTKTLMLAAGAVTLGWMAQGAASPLTDAQRAAILRPVIAHAIDRYNGEKYVGGATALGHWKDGTLGDPAFYTKTVAPIEKELDSLRGLFTPEAANSTVFWLEREALPRWSNIKFDISRRRAEYVRERLMK